MWFVYEVRSLGLWFFVARGKRVFRRRGEGGGVGQRAAVSLTFKPKCDSARK